MEVSNIVRSTVKLKRIALCTVLSTVSIYSTFASTNESKVIYGEDNRANLYETKNPMFLKLADSTVGLMSKDRLTQQLLTGTTRASGPVFKDSYKLCSTERFREESTAAFCSGSLIGKNLILTAGHCVRDAQQCGDTQFVFGFGIDHLGRNPMELKTSDVYSCKSIIHTQLNNGVSYDGADFAIVELDRNVVGHEPLKMARRKVTERLENGTRLVMIGHPSGLPTKVEDGGKVRSTSKSEGFFVATTDSYGGNSGSAVFNYHTGEIEGVLVRGEQDFVEVSSSGTNGSWSSCRVSKVCAENECRGEDVTEITQVTKRIATSTGTLSTQP